MEKFSGTTPALISFLLAIRNEEIPISEETRQAAFKAVFATMLTSFDITQDPKDVRMKAYEQPYRPRSLDPPPKPPRTPCLDSDSLVQLTMHIIEDDTLRHELSLFTSHLGAQATRINPLDFESLFLPFLHSLALKTAITEPPHQEALRTLFATTTTAYHDRFVGPAPPTPPSELDVADGSRRWVRPPVRCTCAANCAPLSAFLADARRHRIEFAVGRQRCAHLHQMLDAAPRTERTHRTLRGGSPEVLVVTKIDWGAVHKRNVRAAWEERLESFGGWMGKLVDAGVDLRAVLGLEEYERVVERRGEASEEGEKDGRAVASAAGELRKRKASEVLVRSSRLQSAEGAGRDVRRKFAETVAVVDLTDE